VRQVGFGVTRLDLDLLGGEISGHGRIDILVRAGDREALIAHGGRDRRHGRAANTDEMNGFDLSEHGAMMACFRWRKRRK
jgi:hypothetical protein